MTATMPSLEIVDVAVRTLEPDVDVRFVEPAAAAPGPVNADVVRRTTAATLWKAEELACRSLALPAFGAEEVALADIAEIEVEEVRRHLASGSRLERVVFAVRGEAAADAFRAALDAGD